jgi:UDP-2,4-diacetamido-2,4,6-trideoxy-beta-L-altropyranose hydrolase
VGDGLSRAALVVADAGPRAGFGHVSRSGAVAVALRAKGYELECRAFGATEGFRRDGLDWSPLEDVADLGPGRCLLVLDSYALELSAVRSAAAPAVVVLMHDATGSESGSADLRVTVAPPERDSEGDLTGARYACLRPVFWGLPAREPPRSVRTVLVSAGTGADGGDIATVTRAALPDARMLLVRGPFDASAAPEDVETIDQPESLLHALRSADLVVTAAGQTMLEAAATGAPCVAFASVDNQRRQLDHVAGLGAVEAAAREELGAAVARVASSPDRLEQLSKRASEVVDGFGALRVAFAADALARSVA